MTGVFQERMDDKNVLTDAGRDSLLKFREKLMMHTVTHPYGNIVLSKGQIGLAGKVSAEIKEILGKDGRTLFFTWVYGKYTQSSKELSQKQLFDLLIASGLYKDLDKKYKFPEAFNLIMALVRTVACGKQLTLIEVPDQKNTPAENMRKMGFY